MKTLVIHPKDSTTEMLALIYKEKDYTIINDPNINDMMLRNAIQAHDRIIMLGHGISRGLINPRVKTDIRMSNPLIINDSHAELLKAKETISVWCYSNEFFQTHRIGGFHTGMIISEVAEAMYVLGHSPLNEQQLNDNMIQFSKVIGQCIDKSPKEMRDYILKHYQGEDAITRFNRNNILVLEGAHPS